MRDCEHHARRENAMTNVMLRRSVAALSVAAFLAAAPCAQTNAQAQAQTQAPKFKSYSVKTPDGLTIAAQEWGNPNGPEIVFIHGFSQSVCIRAI